MSTSVKPVSLFPILARGAVVGLVITALGVAWDWARAPGYVFRGPDGLYWDRLHETAVGWFVPAMAVSLGAAALFGAATAIFRRRRGLPAGEGGTTPEERKGAE